MKSKKGFTLVELLGVIILIGLIILAISSPIISLINNNSKKLDESALKLLYLTTEKFMENDSRTYVKTNGNVYYISLEQLIKRGLLEEDYLDAYSEDVLSKYTQIKVTVQNNNFTYEISKDSLENISEICNSMQINQTYMYNGGKYIKGNIDNNYVLFNGLTFRIMGINSDGTVRLIMDEAATSLSYTDSSFNYVNSHIRNWLNDYFISRLQYTSIIEKQNWYYKNDVNSNNKVMDANVSVEDKVGLLSIEEFNLSLLSNQSYLINGIQHGFINISDGRMYITSIDNNLPYNVTETGEHFVYPVINVLGSSIITSGNGTKGSPYVLMEVLVSKSGKTLDEANLMVGSYLNVDSKLYRVVEKNSDNVKIISYYDTNLYSKYADNNNTFNTYNGVGNLLNSTIISNKFLNKNIFVGEIYSSGFNYKTTVLAKKNLVMNVYSAPPILGEMLTAPLYNINNSLNCYWSLNLANSVSAYQICDNYIGIQNINNYDVNNHNLFGVVFTAYIDINNIITSGDGTINNPYKI